MIKRAFDLIVSGSGLLVLLPVFGIIAILVKCDSSGPVFFRQSRVGRNGSSFEILKFRTMRVADVSSSLITGADDPRITRIGKGLRRFKLDELPQLINVFLGQMSIVGPRPEVAKFVAHYPDACRQKILSVRPGITDEASILYRNESALIGPGEDPERAYVERILPRKIPLYVRYAETHTFWQDLRLIFRTLIALFAPGGGVQQNPDSSFD